MKRIFTIIVEYPDNDVIPSSEVIEVAQECIEQHMERHFGANIMDGDYGRIKVKEVTDGFELVKRMREAQKKEWEIKSKQTCGKELDEHTEVVIKLESEVDEYLEKMEV